MEELAVAVTNKIAVFEIREKGVINQGGILGDRQRFEFEEQIKVMLEISKFISKEKAKLVHKTFIFLPSAFTEEIKPHLRNVDTVCNYRFLYKGQIYDKEKAKLIKLRHRELGIVVSKIPSEEAQIEITISGPNGIFWNSGFFSLGLMDVNLEKEN